MIAISALGVPLVTMIFSLGILVGYYKFFPFASVEKNKRVPNFIYEVNAYDLIKITDENDIRSKRRNLIDYIWQGKGFPHQAMPAASINNIRDVRYAGLQNLKQIDKMIISMEYGVNSVAYLFLAEKSNHRLMIYHQGHDGDFFNGGKTIQFFLNHGFSVVAFAMPLLGMNEQPIVEVTNIGQIQLVSHDQLRLLESSNFSPVKYFVEPIAISLNYIAEKYNFFDQYYMVGVSGGGWTTILYAALDERIRESYAVAGSLPHFLRFEQKNIGDYEQVLPDLYRIANYLELYVMGSYGVNRKQVQIFNRHDTCCFDGELFKTYERAVKKKTSELRKGAFVVEVDDANQTHQVSDYALQSIISRIQQSWRPSDRQ